MAVRPPRNERWLPYAIVGGSALLALTIAAVGTLSLVSLGRDAPPDETSGSFQGQTLIGGPTATPSDSAATPTAFTVQLGQPTSSTTATPGASASGELSPAPTRAADTASRTTSPSRTGIALHTVVQGETLAGIAGQYGITVQTLLLVNNLADPELIKAGEQLQVPAVDGLIHEVEAGDTVARIARLYGVEPEVIGEHNGLDSSYTIRVGQKLIVPGATRPQATATSPPATQAPATQVPASPSPAAASAPTAASAEATPTPTPQPTTPPTVAPQASPTPVPEAPRRRFDWPAMGSVISSFSAEHPGIDLSGNEGAPVLAAADGTVVSVLQLESGYGWQIVVDHGNGYSTMYGHLSAIRVRVGDPIARLQVIGAIGKSGNAPRTQLHFEIRLNGEAVDPRPYLP